MQNESFSFNVTPIWLYAVRTMPSAMLPNALATIVFAPVWAIIGHGSTVRIIGSIAVLWVVGFTLMTRPIVRRRPTVAVTHSSISVLVDDFFRSTKIQRIFESTQAYSRPYLYVIIDDVEPCKIAAEEIQDFAIERSWFFWHKVYAVSQTKRIFLCIRSTRKGADRVIDKLKAVLGR